MSSKQKMYQEVESTIVDMLATGTHLTHDGREYVIVAGGKPMSPHGEPKTDAYARAVSDDGNVLEIKVSVKAGNADFFENKISAKRAAEIFGDDWSQMMRDATCKLYDVLTSRQLINKVGRGRIEPGSITLGWRCDILNKRSGDASVPFVTDVATKVEIITGSTLPADKRDAYVNGVVTPGSGVANLVFCADKGMPSDVSELLEMCVSPVEYAEQMPDMYLAAKAVNYRMIKAKCDGNRPLLVPVRWSAEDGRMSAELRFDEPLEHGAWDMCSLLLATMRALGIETVDDLPDEADTVSCDASRAELEMAA